MPAPSVSLYTQHLEKAGHVRSTIIGMKRMMDDSIFRRNLIDLLVVEAGLGVTTSPADLVGRVDALSAALRDLEITLATIEDQIRGSARYPE